jgi:hypothetical protein
MYTNTTYKLHTMSLPKRLYELGRAISNCDLVTTKKVNAQTMAEFQELLNKSYPVDEKEAAQREIVRSMYYCNPFGFLQYISVAKNRVRALILWTESKRIARFFDVNKYIHISWNGESYSVVPYEPRDTRDTHAQPVTQVTAVTNPSRQLNSGKKTYASVLASITTVYATPDGNQPESWADRTD